MSLNAAGDEDGATLLRQLSECIDELVRKAGVVDRDEQRGSSGGNNSTPKVIDAGDPAVVRLVLLFERAFLHRTKGKRKGGWYFFEACFDPQSALVRFVNTCTDTRTNPGRVRCLLRYCLQTKTLAEHVQMGMHKPKTVQEHYHRDSVVRNEAKAARLLDSLYHLNDISFEILGNGSMDSGWLWAAPSQEPSRLSTSAASSPAKSPRSELSIKSFSPKMARTSLNKRFSRHASASSAKDDDLTSLGSISIASVAASAAPSANSLSHQDDDRLRLERDTLQHKYAALLQEKRESDAAWNKRISAVKEKLLENTEVTEQLEKRLAAETERANRLDAVLVANQQQLQETKAKMAELQRDHEDDASAQNHEEPDDSIETLQQQMQDAFDRYVEAEKKCRRLEETIKQNAAKREAEEQELRGLLDSRDQLCEQLQHSLRHTQKQVEALQSQIESSQATIQSQATDLQGVQQQLRTAEESVSELTSSLQASEASRSQDRARLSVVEQTLSQERERADAAEQLAEVLRQAVEKATEDKLALWNHAENLNEKIVKQRQSETATWQPDHLVTKCSGCRTSFSMFVRKHHCRHCGKIYCNECCNNWFQRASSSKPARVCDGCQERIVSARRGDGGEESSNSTITVQERERTASLSSAQSDYSGHSGGIGAGLLSVSQTAPGPHPPSPLARRLQEQPSSPLGGNRSPISDGDVQEGSGEHGEQRREQQPQRQQPLLQQQPASSGQPAALEPGAMTQ
eukprot:m.233038 g.233038  ORF g.233038 m.233038 type:complete len:745 (-) comp18893_c0_seq2:27-2261(-)